MVLLLVVGAVLYFVPMIVALQREHPQKGPIAIVNLFLGWTVIGWVVAMAWAVSSFERKEL